MAVRSGVTPALTSTITTSVVVLALRRLSMKSAVTSLKRVRKASSTMSREIFKTVVKMFSSASFNEGVEVLGIVEVIVVAVDEGAVESSPEPLPLVSSVVSTVLLNPLPSSLFVDDDVTRVVVVESPLVAPLSSSSVEELAVVIIVVVVALAVIFFTEVVTTVDSTVVTKPEPLSSSSVLETVVATGVLAPLPSSSVVS